MTCSPTSYKWPFWSDKKFIKTEEEGFEPPVPYGTAVFKTAALNHSATPPNS